MTKPIKTKNKKPIFTVKARQWHDKKWIKGFGVWNKGEDFCWLFWTPDNDHVEMTLVDAETLTYL